MANLEPTPPKTPVSPKVVAGAVAALLLPFGVAALSALISYFMGDGAVVFGDLPSLVKSMILALLAAAASALAAYQKRDPIREEGARRGVV